MLHSNHDTAAHALSDSDSELDYDSDEQQQHTHSHSNIAAKSSTHHAHDGHLTSEHYKHCPRYALLHPCQYCLYSEISAQEHSGGSSSSSSSSSATPSSNIHKPHHHHAVSTSAASGSAGLVPSALGNCLTGCANVTCVALHPREPVIAMGTASHFIRVTLRC